MSSTTSRFIDICQISITGLQTVYLASDACACRYRDHYTLIFVHISAFLLIFILLTFHFSLLYVSILICNLSGIQKLKTLYQRRENTARPLDTTLLMITIIIIISLKGPLKQIGKFRFRVVLHGQLLYSIIDLNLFTLRKAIRPLRRKGATGCESE